MAKKKVEIIAVASAQRAHRRRLPAVIASLNAKIRDGQRSFMPGTDFTDGMFPIIVRAFRRSKGWTVSVNERYGWITIHVPGEPAKA